MNQDCFKKVLINSKINFENLNYKYNKMKGGRQTGEKLIEEKLKQRNILISRNTKKTVIKIIEIGTNQKSQN